MEYLDSFDQSWITPKYDPIDPIDDFAEAFAFFTDGLLSADLDDLERAIAAARAVAIVKHHQRNLEDGQS